MANFSRLKDRHIVQMVIFNTSEMSYSDLIKYQDQINFGRNRQDQTGGKNSWIDVSRFNYLQVCINEFCKKHDILDIEPSNRFGSTLHDGTFSKTSTTNSLTPQYTIYYQIPIDGSES